MLQERVCVEDAWEHEANRAKLVKWYWNGVFGELYGSAVETRVARDFVEVPLAAMDVMLSAERYLNLPVAEAELRLRSLVEWAAEHGGGFAVLWHSEQYDSALLPGWDRLYRRLVELVGERGGACLQAGVLAEEARAWLS